MTHLKRPAYSAALAVFRILFGMMILVSMLRFAAKGWISELYIQPRFFFKYYGFEWVQPLGDLTYGLFFICGASALLFALGLFYRVSSLLLFLSFTYIELMDKTNYLNHYYFVSLVLFLMIWLPANGNMALDNLRRPRTACRFVSSWTIDSIRLLLGMVYFFAGLAKLNSDWLLEAMPLRLWLPAKNDLPLAGPLFNEVWIAYVFSWFGALYDLSVPFLLWNRKTRPYAYVAVILFHICTSVLFPIGMFPYIMVLATLIFFSPEGFDRMAQKLKNRFPGIPVNSGPAVYTWGRPWKQVWLLRFFTLFFVIQFLIPLRYLLYPGSVLWTEEGYRFSWRVMLMEKMGYAQFVVVDRATGKRAGVNNNEFLTRNQEKMMATQGDFIIQYAHYLKRHYEQLGMAEPEVYAKVMVTLNGRRSTDFVDPGIDLAKMKTGLVHKKWILPFKDKIYGL